MAVELAVAYVSLVPSAKGIRGQIEKELDVDKIATAEGQKAGGAFSKAFSAENSEQMKKLGKGFLAVGAIAGVALGGAIKSASDLNESINAVQVTFGAAADGILELGENAAKSVGLSKNEFNGLAVQFSAFAQTIAGEGGDVVGVIDDLTVRGADFASVMNLEVNEAMRLFQSGLAGETEPLRKFGIDLSAAAVESHAYATGIADVGAKLTESEKVQARYSLLMEQTAKTAGDFANTSDSLANATRIAKAEFQNAAASIGQQFLPIMSKVVGGVGDAVGMIGKLNEASGGMVGSMLAVVTVTGTVAGSALYAAGKIGQMRQSFQNLSTTSRNIVTGLGIVTLALTAGVAIYSQYNKRKQESTARTNEFVAALEAEASGQDDAVNQMLASRLAHEKFREIQEATGIAAADMARFIRGETVPAIDALAKSTPMVHDALQQLRDEFEEAERVQSQTTATTEELTKATEDQTDAMKPLDVAIRDIVESATAGATMQNALATATELATEAAEEAKKAHDDLVDTMLRGIKTTFNYEKSVLNLESAYDKYQLQVLETTATLKDSEVADRDKEQALRDLRAQEIGLAEDALATAEAYAAEQGAVEGSSEAIGLQIDKLREMQDQYPELRDEIQTYIDKLEAIPPEKFTTVKPEIDQIALDNVERFLDKLGRPRTSLITPTVKGAALPSAAGRFVPGGSNLLTTAGELAGSRGDEVILPLGDPSRMLELLAHPRVGGRVFDALAGLGAPAGGGLPDKLTLIVEGQPLTAVVARHDRALAGAVSAGRR